jgi:hypothetical protein
MNNEFPGSVITVNLQEAANSLLEVSFLGRIFSEFKKSIRRMDYGKGGNSSEVIRK